jgi:N-acetyl-anhydromuramyl-L-alanine amidase AmpD
MFKSLIEFIISLFKQNSVAPDTTISSNMTTNNISIKQLFVKYYATRPKPPIGIIIHYTAVMGVKEARIQAMFDERQVSADYYINRIGQIYQLIPEGAFSYHAGESKMSTGEFYPTKSGKPSVNAITIGIELEATQDSGFSNEQYNSLILLSKTLIIKYNIDINKIVGHEEVALPKGRKQDPGRLFDWNRYKSAL